MTPTGHTDPTGQRKPDAPPSWPFGTVTPPTKRQQRDELLARLPEAPL